MIFLISYFITKKRKLLFFIVKKKKLILIIFISAIVSNTYFRFVSNQYELVYKNFPENIKSYGTIVSNYTETDYYEKYIILIENKKFILYKKKNEEKLKYGMEIYLEGTYSVPEGARNYNGFNYKEYLKTKKIYGSIKADKLEIVKEKNINFFQIYSNKIKTKIIEIIENISSENTKGLLESILIGETDGLNDDIKEYFRESNLSHILAISGTHISYIIVGISFLLTKSKVPKRNIYIAVSIFLLFFMYITGLSPSIVRACIMGIIVLLSKIFYRKPDVLTSISISLILTLLSNPYSINNIGLQLSYIGTLGIVFFNKPIQQFLEKYINKKIAEAVSVTISAQILILPITIVEFNNFSTLFIISNILAVPIAGIIILIGYLNILIGFISLNIASVVGIITNGTVQILIWIAQIVSKIPFSNIIITTPNKIAVFAYYILIYAIWKKKYIKQFSILLIILLVVSYLVSLNLGNLTIYFVDVGQRRLYTNYNTKREKDINRYWRRI